MTKSKIPAFMNWSGGKDSSLALSRVIDSGEYDVRYLVTTVNELYGRVSMHGVREELLDKQAESIGIPLVKCYLPADVTMSSYEDSMIAALESFRKEGITVAIFGDIFLEDLREYREKKLSESGFNAVFPLWKNDTSALVDEFIDSGFRAIVSAIDARFLDESFAGRFIDRDFVGSLPEGVDPCGENGEYHSFVIDGPIFGAPLRVRQGEKKLVEHDSESQESGGTHAAHSFWFCDILPE